ncbi:MAG: diadenylate cyclase [Deltaproteobacteria bacterium]|nr:diadenylate cyclase [Deltaproteobacteria bacterium]
MEALFSFVLWPWRFAWTISWRALVDIALMTFLVYQVSIRFRGTQAARIGAGLAILGVLYVLAQSMGLLLTTWVLGGLWAAALILVIVLFQAEIRQVLVQVNRATPSLRQVFRRARRLTDLADVLATIAATCFALGEKRCGALLVFERRDPLEPLLRNPGVVVDARVSPQLLETVFTPPTPLHDGALYLRAGRVYRAGCILPLSETSSLPSYYGTRRRAAGGSTERSDALAVVVSEERGEITVVEWGEMVTLTGPLKLRAWLTPRLSNPPAARTSGWAGSLRPNHNWQAKLGALAVVSLLWLVVVGPQNTEVGFTIPVVYHNIPEDLDLVGQHTQEVYLGVRGSRELLRFLNQGRLRAEIDLKEAREGTTRYSLSAHEVNLPLGLQVAGVDPPTVTVHLKKKPLPKKLPDGSDATKEPS